MASLAISGLTPSCYLLYCKEFLVKTPGSDGYANLYRILNTCRVWESVWRFRFRFFRSTIHEVAVKPYGKLDILVNNAGAAGDDRDETTEEDRHRLIDANHTSIFLGCKYAIPEMKNEGGGIVNIASIAGIIGVPTLRG